MQITKYEIACKFSRNIVNGPKTNNYVLVRNWVIVWVQKPSHHFLQTFRPLGHACLRLCSAIVHFIRKITFNLSAKADQRKHWRHWLH